MVQALLVAGVPASEIRCYPLDDRTVHTVRLARNEPTTCVFPGPITALEGGNVSQKPEDAPPVLLSHQPGAGHFSLRALQDDARAALNVIYRGKVYALTFVTAAEPDRAVVFQEPPVIKLPPPGQPALPVTLRSLLDRAQHHELLAQQYPLLTRSVERATPEAETLYPGFKVTVTEVFRFDPEDALVFRARVDNTSGRLIRFDPSGISVRIGPTLYPAALAESDGEIPAGGSATIWFVVAGDGRGGRANLSVHNTFFVLVPTHP